MKLSMILVLLTMSFAVLADPPAPGAPGEAGGATANSADTLCEQGVNSGGRVAGSDGAGADPATPANPTGAGDQ